MCENISIIVPKNCTRIYSSYVMFPTCKDRRITGSSVTDTLVDFTSTLPGTANIHIFTFIIPYQDGGYVYSMCKICTAVLCIIHGLPEGWIASTEEELREDPTSLTEETKKWNEWQARASASDTLCV